ncbi:MAG: HNH endonuclease [Paludibacter sp.]
MKKPLNYRFYATLLDKYQSYLSSSDIYNEFWGYSEDPEFTEDEFEEKQKQSLIDAINRVPFDSEAADRGTAFNEVIDCIIMKCKSDKMIISSIKETRRNPNYNPDFDNYGRPTIEVTVAFKAIFKEREFIFPAALCFEFSTYYHGGIPQVYCESPIETRFGNVLLYGYIDELMPFKVCDIKTSTKYSAGKFKRNWQHIVYPYCLNQQGNDVSDFEYNVAVIAARSYSTFTEHYAYVPERDNKRLVEHCEKLIEFIELNKDQITDKKIFNQY